MPDYLQLANNFGPNFRTWLRQNLTKIPFCLTVSSETCRKSGETRQVFRKPAAKVVKHGRFSGNLQQSRETRQAYPKTFRERREIRKVFGLSREAYGVTIRKSGEPHRIFGLSRSALHLSWRVSPSDERLHQLTGNWFCFIEFVVAITALLVQYLSLSWKNCTARHELCANVVSLAWQARRMKMDWISFNPSNPQSDPPNKKCLNWRHYSCLSN